MNTAPHGCEYGACRADAERGSFWCADHHPVSRIVAKNQKFWAAMNGNCSDTERRRLLNEVFAKEPQS